jgi:two-component system OmpR family sensor kinase/two-component system sensor histidine kinase QseC
MRDRHSTWSLRRRLWWISAFALAASLLFGGLALYWAASAQEDQMLDARLEHLGATVLSFVEEELNEADPSGALKYHNLKTRPTAALLYRYQVWSRDGALLLRSHEASADAPLMLLSKLGFDTVYHRGEEYRAFSLPTKDFKFVIQVAENIDERWAQNGLTAAYYGAFLLVPFGLVFAATWMMLRGSLRSIDTVAEQLSHRNPMDLTALQVDKPPEELLPILKAIDTLFARVGHALSVERSFTAVAAHEMRTPLAGLRAQAQIASKASSREELREAQQALLLGVDRASHMLDQLLDLARIESLPQGADLRLESVNLSDVYQAVMRDLGPTGARKRIDFAARFPVEAVHCHAFALQVLLRNLVANAILYTPIGGRVEVSSALLDQSVALAVDDSGPGIRASERERAFERFNRLGQSQTEGVGLGLSIALSVVELHNARIQLLDSPLGGLRAQVLFEPAPDAAHQLPSEKRVLA